TLYHATEPPRYVPPPTPPPAREEAPMETAPANFFTVSGDFLFWTAPEDGLTYVLNCATGSTTVSNCGSQEVEALWDPGFRIDAGYTWGSDMWDVKTRWTWFKNNGKHFASGTLFPVWPHPNDNSGTVTSSTSNWDLQFNAIDLEIAKTFKPSGWMTFRPHSGLKGAFIDQNFLNVYNGLVTPWTFPRAVFIENDFWGVGIRGGIDSSLDLGSGFQLVGKAAGSVLWGKFYIRNNETSSSTTYVRVGDRFETTRSALEGALGLNVRTTFLLGESAPINFYSLWEMQIWFSQNMMKRFVDATADGIFLDTRGDLGLHGATFGMNINF
ncbi:MAG TPA: Lpg1974 family pore-forming outer membrane protein, partial [Bdellovibrionota bacterium]|nr:Lpg1974 family pore-forming outer membrane protein [Bdellovibrionota bacterium]